MSGEFSVSRSRGKGLQLEDENTVIASAKKDDDGSITFTITVGSQVAKTHLIRWALAQRGSDEARKAEVIEGGKLIIETMLLNNTDDFFRV